MNPSFEQTLVEVWRQALVENATEKWTLCSSQESAQE